MTLELIHGEEKDANEIRSQFILFLASCRTKGTRLEIKVTLLRNL